MAYCETLHQIKDDQNQEASWRDLRLAAHRKRCQLCRLIGLLDEYGGIPLAVIQKLGLTVWERPGNAWIGAETRQVVTYQNWELPIIED